MVILCLNIYEYVCSLMTLIICIKLLALSWPIKGNKNLNLYFKFYHVYCIIRAIISWHDAPSCSCTYTFLSHILLFHLLKRLFLATLSNFFCMISKFYHIFKILIFWKFCTSAQHSLSYINMNYAHQGWQAFKLQKLHTSRCEILLLVVHTFCLNMYWVI